MSIIPVMKFGGTTLQGEVAMNDPRHQELLAACRLEEGVENMYQAVARCRLLARAQRLVDVATDFIIPHLREGRTPVVITSAFGWATDKWLSLSKAISEQPDQREYARLQMTGELRSNSALAMVLREKGFAARSLTGREAGVVTTPQYVDALIESVDIAYVAQLVQEGTVPIVAGFQGYFHDGRTGRDEVSILGRGGSNLTAVALARALGQRECCMYSDVVGVYNKDPRKHEDAVKHGEIYAEDLFRIEPFPQVIQQEAVQFAIRHGIDIWIKSGSEPGKPGSLIICRRKACIFV
jgi:aspartate kinase